MIKDLLLSIRYKNLFILSFLFICLELLLFKKDELSQFHLSSLYPYLVVILTAAGGYVINDLFDQKGDQLNNKRQHPFFTTSSLIILYILLSLSSIIIACIFTSMAMQQITCLSVLFLLLYSWKLQHWPFLGNLIVAILAGIVPLIVFIAHPEILPIFKDQNTPTEKLIHYLFILLYAFFAFLTTLARELIKDMEDIDGDRLINSKTLAVTAGIRFTKILTMILLIFISLLLLLLLKDREEMHFSTTTSISIIFLLLFPICTAGWKLTKAHTTNQFKMVSNILKMVFAGSLIVIIFHSFT